MNFDKLKGSLVNNADEQPTLFMAMCLIETLFRDLRDESGTDIASLEPGDETLPLKLTLVYRNLNKIYETNKDSFTRGVEKLDKMAAAASEIEQQLGQLGEDYKRLDEVKTQYETRKKEYELATAQKEEYEKIQKELSELEGVDTNSLTAEIEEGRRKLEEVNRSIGDSVDELNALNERYAGLVVELGNKKEEVDHRRSDCETKNGLLREADEELQKLEQEKNTIINELGQKQDAINSTSRSIAPVRAMLAKEQEKLETSEKEKEELTGKLDSISAETAALEQMLIPLRQRTAALEEQKKQLTEECGQQNEEIRKLSDEVAELSGKTNDEKLSIRKAQLQKEKAQYEELIHEFDGLGEEIAFYEKKNQDIKKRIEERTASRDNHEADRVRLQNMLGELSFYRDPEFLKEIEGYKAKLQALDKVATALSRSASDISQYTGNTVESYKDIEAVRNCVTRVGELINSYRNSLIELSRTIRSEDK